MTNEREVAHDFVNKVEDTLNKFYLKFVEGFDSLHEAIDKVADQREAAAEAGTKEEVDLETIMDDIANFQESVVKFEGYESPFRNAEYRNALINSKASGDIPSVRHFYEHYVPDEFKTKVSAEAPSADGSDLLNRLRNYAKDNGLI